MPPEQFKDSGVTDDRGLSTYMRIWGKVPPNLHEMFPHLRRLDLRELPSDAHKHR